MLAGRDPGVQAAALVDLVSLFIAGHHPDTREPVLAVFVEGVRSMVPGQAQEMFGPKGWPR